MGHGYLGGGWQLHWPSANQTKNKEGQGCLQYQLKASAAVGTWHRVTPCVWWMTSQKPHL